MKCISVHVEKTSYRIEIGWGSLAKLGERVAQILSPCRVALLTDEHVWPIHGNQVEQSLRAAGFDVKPIVIPAGEEQKSLESAAKIYDELVGCRFDRNSALVALGGGVVGDLGGFVAATYMRGIPFIQVPTTLLAQVDSSVGGKVGVNHPRGKNLIGAFYQPAGVFMDPALICSLPRPDLTAGLAEVIKYGIIRDSDLFHYLREHREEILALCPEVVEHIIDRSCQIKAEVVSRDEKEAGLRMILNYGHTIGHALEAAKGYGHYRHGEMVSIGMIAAARLSERMSLAHPGLVREHHEILESFSLPTHCPISDAEDVLARMYLDKKTQGNRLRFVLAARIGEVAIYDQVSESDVRVVLKEVNSTG